MDTAYGNGLPVGYYGVERILEKRSDGRYLIKWAGFPDSSNTWLLKHSISPALVREFEGELLAKRKAKREEKKARRKAAQEKLKCSCNVVNSDSEDDDGPPVLERQVPLPKSATNVVPGPSTSSGSSFSKRGRPPKKYAERNVDFLSVPVHQGHSAFSKMVMEMDASSKITGQQPVQEEPNIGGKSGTQNTETS